MRLVLGLIVTVVSVGAGAAYLGFMPDLSIPALSSLKELAIGQQQNLPEEAPTTIIQDKPARLQQAGAAPVASDSASAFDVAKIEPKGTSVFAGRATPKSVVTVLVDGEPVGTVIADQNGEWALIVERPFANPSPKLSIVTRAESASGGTPSPKRVTTAAAASQQLIENLRNLVARARTKSAASPSPTQKAALESAQLPAAAKTEPDLSARPEVLSTALMQERRIVPIPIKFVFKKATFTKEGREAVKLLVEYVLLEKLPSLTLTGHADERGTPALNMELSSARLFAVARSLKGGGYSGKLELVPRGETEPFTGVDRRLFSRDELFELDRRVELRLSD